MQMRQRSVVPKGVHIVLCGLLLLGACAHQIPAPQRNAALGVSVAPRTIFVASMAGEFGREMQAAVGAELGKSPHYRVVDAEVAADFVLSGGLAINPQRPEDPPVGWVRLRSQASGTDVWQYMYREQRTGNELFVPPPPKQVKIVARQVVAELLTATTARAANANGSF